jgi:ABC-2 type transport system permease protein
MTPARPRRSVLSQGRALFAVTHKNWLIFTRYPNWFMVFIIWPVLFPLGYIFTAKALGGPEGSALASFEALTGTRNYLAYIVIGSTFYMWLNITLWDVGFQLRQEQMRGTLESNWLAPVSRLSLLVGGSLLSLGTSLFFLLVTTVEFRLFFGVNLASGNIGLLLLVLLLTALAVYGIGFAFASLVLRFREANAMVFLVRGIFMVFCGITYPLAVMPEWMQGIAAFLPLTYAIQALRDISLSGAGLGVIAPDLVKLAAFATVLPVLGILAFYAMERRARRTGSLGQY